MSYRKSSFVYNREVTKTGVASYEDVYSIIRDNVDNEVEFYEIEPAIVTKVYLEPKDLPYSNGISDYSKYGTIKARFLYSQSGDDEISEITLQFRYDWADCVTANPASGVAGPTNDFFKLNPA